MNKNGELYTARRDVICDISALLNCEMTLIWNNVVDPFYVTFPVF